MSRWPEFLTFCGGVALGVFACAAFYERSRASGLDEALVVAKALPAKHVQAERAVVQASTRAEADRKQGRALAAAGSLAGCPLDADTAGLLSFLTQSTTAPAGPTSLPSGPVPRPGSPADSRGGGGSGQVVR